MDFYSKVIKKFKKASNVGAEDFVLLDTPNGLRRLPSSQLPEGAKGEKGDKGDKGAKGDKGDKGDTPDISPLQTEINDLKRRVTALESAGA